LAVGFGANTVVSVVRGRESNANGIVVQWQRGFESGSMVWF